MWNKRLKEIVKRLPPSHSGIAIWDDYNESFPKDQDCIGTLTTNIGSSTPRNGIKIIEIYETNTNINTANHHFIVEEVKIIKEGNYSPSGHNASSIVNANGISPAVMENHGTVTAVAEPIRIPEATAQGYAEAYEGDSVNLAVPNSKTRRGRVGKQMVNTLDTGSQQGVVVAEPSEDWQTVVGNKQLNPFRGSVEGTSPCITSACGAGGGMTPMLTDADLGTTKTKEFIEQVRGHEDIRYRIRKLTPRECFRLMGVDDADIDKIQASGISNSQQYKCAGNSIVVDVLYHLFRKMFCETENESDQLTLF